MLSETNDPQQINWSTDTIESLANTWRRTNQSYVIATVIDNGGSTPRLAGTRLITDGRIFGGTVGGGAVEQLVLSRCASLLASKDRSDIVSVHLVRDLAMCCGGKMSVFLNKVEANPNLVIFGGGHIGRSLASLCKESEFAVTVVDERPEWIDAERFGQHITRIHEDPVWYAKKTEFAENTAYLIVTHAHELDQELIEVLLKKDRMPGFVGLIGSRGKWARFRDRLLAKGFSKERLDSVRCPCGVDIGSETPGEIAVSVLAQLIQQHRQPR